MVIDLITAHFQLSSLFFYFLLAKAPLCVWFLMGFAEMIMGLKAVCPNLALKLIKMCSDTLLHELHTRGSQEPGVMGPFFVYDS